MTKEQLQLAVELIRMGWSPDSEDGEFVMGVYPLWIDPKGARHKFDEAIKFLKKKAKEKEKDNG